MTKLPIVCKHVCSYTYAKVTKYRPLYVLLLEYNEEGKQYLYKFTNNFQFDQFPFTRNIHIMSREVRHFPRCAMFQVYSL